MRDEKSQLNIVFGVAPGVDFARSVARGISDQFRDNAPEDLARVTILANSSRMRRRLTECFSESGARLLPRIHLVSDVTPLLPETQFPSATSGIQRHLDFLQLLKPLLDSPAAPAPKSAIHDLAESLMALIDEMRIEGVSPDALRSINVDGQAKHWSQTQSFLHIVQEYVQNSEFSGGDASCRQRAATEALICKWQAKPPDHPVYIVGSTGSRGTTFDLMKTVARLPKGNLVLPGFDHDMPPEIWDALSQDTVSSEDHAQSRYAKLLDALELPAESVGRWSEAQPDPMRNKLISLALRPAPVTNQWRKDGPYLGSLLTATKGVSLIEAPHPREEAGALAVAMRNALISGKRCALVTPDRTLARRVTAALGRWGIKPDDSAGMPLSLSPPGRFVRHIVRFIGRPLEPGDLITLLRHPLCRTGTDDRGNHVRFTNELELACRKAQLPYVTAEIVTKQGEDDAEWSVWCQWVCDVLELIQAPLQGRLSDAARRILEIAAFLAGGGGDTSGRLWELEAGQKTLGLLEGFSQTGTLGPTMSRLEVQRLLEHALSRENVRNSEVVRQDAMILGALEARVLDADLVLLGGLNDGTWPSAPKADPWLSRGMRRDAGLLSPERQVGLSAHDFQQAVCSQEVILSRSTRDEDAETVPSRWVNRLTNLLSGLPETGGSEALSQMRDRGRRFLAQAIALDAPLVAVEPAARPSPAPPSAHRPTSLSVTAVEKLIRDPYWIYCRHVLKLRSLDALKSEPSPALRGAVFHKVVELFTSGIRDGTLLANTHSFKETVSRVLTDAVPWPATRRMWLGHLSAIAEDFVAAETMRLEDAYNLKTEARGRLEIVDTPFVITAEADRLDLGPDGHLIIYDYKSGSIPTRKQTIQFSPQILLEAIIAEGGGFAGLDEAVAGAGAYLSLGRSLGVTRFPFAEDVPLDNKKQGETGDFTVATARSHLIELLSAYAQSHQGYQSRRAMEKMRFEGDYDHLARFGEWDETDDPVTVDVP